MALFKNAYESHEHSLRVLDMIYGYDSFLDNLKVIADMGCGAGLDSQWWAELTTRDDPPEPHNYTVYAVDHDMRQLEPDLKGIKNLIPIEGDFEQRVLPRNADLIWAHDSLQYAKDPFACLGTWKRSINVNGMLVVSLPQTTHVNNAGNLIINHYSDQIYNFNLLNLTYMLAASGFDCRDAYFYRESGTPWLHAAVYATDREPYEYRPSWYELAEAHVLNESMVTNINKYGYAKMENMVVSWFDRDNYVITN